MILIELRMCDRMKKKNGQMSDELKQRRDIMERKKKIIVAVAAVLVLMVGLMAWKKSETKLSGRYKTDQSTQYIYMLPETSVYKGYKQDKIEMRGDRAEMSDFPLYLNTVAGGLDRRDQTIGGFSFVVKIYAVPVVEIIG